MLFNNLILVCAFICLSMSIISFPIHSFLLFQICCYREEREREREKERERQRERERKREKERETERQRDRDRDREQ